MVHENSDGDPKALADAMRSLQHLARDHARVPMPWNSVENGGFSQNKPWMHPNDDYAICNVQDQQKDRNSVLAFWRRALEVRKEKADVLVYGNFGMVDSSNDKVFTFTKENNGQKVLVTLNFSDQQQSLVLPEKAKIMFSTGSTIKDDNLSAFEGRMYRV